MMENKQSITREGLRQELQNKHILNVSRTTLSLILKDIGFVYEKDKGYVEINSK